MNRNDFVRQMDKICRRWKKPTLDGEDLEDWFEELKHIPKEAWEEIGHSWWKYERQFPTPGDLEIRWREWWGKHKEKQDRTGIVCEECKGLGGFIVKGLECLQTMSGEYLSGKAEAFVLCKACQTKPIFRLGQGVMRLRVMTREQIENLGGTIQT